ncbi:MAG: acyl-CoA thioesterase [Rhodospirillales bacterium]
MTHPEQTHPERPNPRHHTRGIYPYRVDLQSRFGDNDMFGHFNNAAYNLYIQEVICRFLMDEIQVDWRSDEFLTYAAETLCRFYAPIEYPELVEGRLRIERLGRTSITYGIGLFVAGRETPAAAGHFVHVIVDPKTEKPITIPDRVRTILGRFL